MIPAWVNSKNGAVYLNDLKRYVKGSILVPGQSVTPLVIGPAVGPGVPTAAPSVVIESPTDAISEVYALVGEQDAGVNPDVAARMTCQITDVAFRRRLMNRDIPVTHVFGGGGVNGSGGIPGYLPFFLRETMLLEAQQTQLIDFINNSTAGSTSFRFAYETRKFQAVSLSRSQVSDYINQERFRKTLLNPYWLTTDQPVTLNPMAGQDIFFTNTKATYFVAFGAIATFVLNAGVPGGDIVEGFTVDWFDAKTERPLQNQSVARSCCMGSAGLPFQFPTALVFEPNTRMRMRLNSLVTGVTQDVFVTLIGVNSYTLDNPFENQVSFAPPSAASRGVP
jgi:hypothetical protein